MSTLFIIPDGGHTGAGGGFDSNPPAGLSISGADGAPVPTGSGGPSKTPMQILGASVKTFYVAMADVTHLFSDTPATAQASLGGQVASMTDNLGGTPFANNADNATPSVIGTLQQDGAGHHYLLMDGDDDTYNVGGFSAASSDITLVFVLKDTSTNAGERWILDANGASQRIVIGPRGSNSFTPPFMGYGGNAFAVFNGSRGWDPIDIPAIEQPVVISLRFDSTAGQCFVRRNGFFIGQRPYTASDLGGEIQLGSGTSGGDLYANFKGRLYGFCVTNQLLSLADTLELEKNLAENSATLTYLADGYTEIVAAGDSITRGHNDDVTADDISATGKVISPGYTPVLTDALNGISPASRYAVVSEAQNGRTCDQLIALLPTIFARQPGGTYLIMIGTNDSTTLTSGLGLGPSDTGYTGSYKDKLQQIVDLCTSNAKTVHFSHLTWVFNEPTVAANCKDFSQVVTEICADNNLLPPPYVWDYFNLHQNEVTLGSHPNGTGYQSLAHLWLERISWGPADLYSGADTGLWLSAWRTNTLYRDEGASASAAVGDKVLWWEDVSGNSNSASADPSTAPTLSSSATHPCLSLSAGNVLDLSSAGDLNGSTWTLMLAIECTGTSGELLSDSGSAGYVGKFASGSSDTALASAGITISAVRVNDVAQTVTTQGDLFTAIDSTASAKVVSIEFTASAAFAPQLGATGGVACHLYGLALINRGLTRKGQIVTTNRFLHHLPTGLPASG